MSKIPFRHWVVGLACCGLTIFLGYFARRADFWSFISAYAVFFGLYGWVIRALVFTDAGQHNQSSGQISRYYLGLGLLLRVLLLFSIPHFSDDVFRFLWDGRLSAAGIHPFAHPPVYFIENQVFPPGITPELFGQLNSSRYFTVYPPVCQAIFWLSAQLAPHSTWGGVFVMKLFLLACEAGTLFLLPKLHAPHFSRFPLPSSLLYALNPLVILEITGNCHFEGAMIFFLLAGLLALQRGKVVGAAAYWAFAVASKLVPLLFLPLVGRWLGGWRGLRFMVLFGVVSLLLFIPMLNAAVVTNMGKSLDLYFQKFQFNASLYYLLRAAGFWYKGYDVGFLLGPWLGIGVFCCTLGLTFFRLKKDAPFEQLTESMLFALSLQLLCAATVHAWYVAPLLALGLLTRWHFAVIWSGAVALSYSHYANGAFQENYWLIALEYVLVVGAWMLERRARAKL